jgi:hypothetical protein
MQVLEVQVQAVEFEKEESQNNTIIQCRHLFEAEESFFPGYKPTKGIAPMEAFPPPRPPALNRKYVITDPNAAKENQVTA